MSGSERGSLSFDHPVRLPGFKTVNGPDNSDQLPVIGRTEVPITFAHWLATLVPPESVRGSGCVSCEAVSLVVSWRKNVTYFGNDTLRQKRSLRTH